MSESNSEKKLPKYRNTQHFIEEILYKKLKWKIHPQKFVLCKGNGRILKEPDFEIEYEFDQISKHDRTNINLPFVQRLIQREIFNLKEVFWEKIKNDMHDPNLQSQSEIEMEKLVRAIVPNETEKFYQKGITYARNKLRYILLNFYKQIKHKIINEEDFDYPVVPIFVGTQGLSKSKLVKYLTDFFNPFVKKMDINQVTDFDRFYKLLRDRMVIRIDELDGADKAPLNILKSLITDYEITAKRYFSQNPVEDYCFATFIITSNKRSYKVFRDPSGNRRWADFEIFQDFHIKDFEDINLSTLIKGIPLSDTEEERLRMRRMSEEFLIPDQMQYKHQDEVEEFIDEASLFINYEQTERNKFISKDELFKDFNTFRKQLGRHTTLTANHFWNNLKDVLKTVEVDSSTYKKCTENVIRKKSDKSKRGIMIDLETYNKRKKEVLNDCSVFYSV